MELSGTAPVPPDAPATGAARPSTPPGPTAGERAAWEHEREQLLAELRRRAADLAEFERRTDELLAMLAHELRNPLAPVLHAVELLRDGHADPPACRRALEAASRQVRHMARLVDDLVDVSRIRGGKVALQRGPVALSEVVESAVQALEPLLLERCHALSVELPEEPVWLDADAVRLAQVFENLLHNAAKYTDEGGHLRLVAGRHGDELVLRVRDDGMGIPAEVLPRVFDLFVQGEQPPDRSRGGLGLGLSLVKSIVEMHGGSVQARSDGPGHGTELTVRLPTIELGASGGAEPAGTVSAAHRNGHAALLPPLVPPPVPPPRPPQKTPRAP
jgi:signal transduction histidine kinase